jgi:hypothetical protein
LRYHNLIEGKLVKDGCLASVMKPDNNDLVLFVFVNKLLPEFGEKVTH